MKNYYLTGDTEIDFVPKKLNFEVKWGFPRIMKLSMGAIGVLVLLIAGAGYFLLT